MCVVLLPHHTHLHTYVIKLIIWFVRQCCVYPITASEIMQLHCGRGWGTERRRLSPPLTMPSRFAHQNNLIVCDTTLSSFNVCSTCISEIKEPLWDSTMTYQLLPHPTTMDKSFDSCLYETCPKFEEISLPCVTFMNEN